MEVSEAGQRHWGRKRPSVGRPAPPRQRLHLPLRRLGAAPLDLWQLPRIDPTVPAADQFGEIRTMQDEGLIRLIGLSEVSVDDVVAAQEFFEVASVQNRYNLADRASEALLDFSIEHGIGFIPWYPLGARALVATDGPLGAIAAAKGCTPSQVALAWLLQRSPVMLPIPGTGSIAHLEENCAAAGVRLSDAEMAALDALS